MGLCTIIAEDGYDQIRIQARCLFQHTPYEARVLDVTPSGAKRLDAFLNQHRSDFVSIQAGRNHPTFIGYTIRND